MNVFFLLCYILAGSCWLIDAVCRLTKWPFNSTWLLPFGLVWFIIPCIIVAGQSVDGP